MHVDSTVARRPGTGYEQDLGSTLRLYGRSIDPERVDRQAGEFQAQHLDRIVQVHRQRGPPGEPGSLLPDAQVHVIVEDIHPGLWPEGRTFTARREQAHEQDRCEQIALHL
jgi:hypothetical protein